MRKFSSILMLLIVTLLLLVATGCANNDNSSTSKNQTPGASVETAEGSGASGEEDSAPKQEAIEAPADSGNAQASSTDNQNSGSTDDGQKSSNNGLRSLSENYTEEEKKAMGDLTGNWESQTPNENGTTKVVRAKIDNVNGFTITTGDMNPDGQGTFYSRVGSYELQGNNITFSATTGGQSNDGTSYKLRQDPGVFQYTFAENPELTQLTLTPTNDAAKQLTGDAPIVLSK